MESEQSALTIMTAEDREKLFAKVKADAKALKEKKEADAKALKEKEARALKKKEEKEEKEARALEEKEEKEAKVLKQKAEEKTAQEKYSASKEGVAEACTNLFNKCLQSDTRVDDKLPNGFKLNHSITYADFEKVFNTLNLKKQGYTLLNKRSRNFGYRVLWGDNGNCVHITDTNEVYLWHTANTLWTSEYNYIYVKSIDPEVYSVYKQRK